MRLVTSFSVMIVIAFPIANCQVKMRVREKDLIIPTEEPSTEETSEVPLHIKRRRRKGFPSTVSPHLQVAPTEPRIRVGLEGKLPNTSFIIIIPYFLMKTPL